MATAPTMAAAPMAAAPMAAGGAFYTVRAGDTLSSIAAAQLGSAGKAAGLFAANKGRLEPGGAVVSRPNLIEPGWTLTLSTQPAPAAAMPVPPAPLRVVTPTPPMTVAPPTPTAQAPAQAQVPVPAQA